MKCNNCKYYIKEEKRCRAFNQQVKKKKSCWRYAEESSIVEQALKVLLERKKL